MSQDLNAEIARLQLRQKEISAKLGSLYGEASIRAHQEYQRNHWRLGRLMLQRDKIERPEVYRS